MHAHTYVQICKSTMASTDYKTIMLGTYVHTKNEHQNDIVTYAYHLKSMSKSMHKTYRLTSIHIMEYGSTPYVGLTQKNMAAIN